MAREKKTPERNLLEMVPLQLVEFEDVKDDRVTVLRPKFLKGPFARWVQPRLNNPYYRVHLDEIGSKTWRLIDGERPVSEIVEILRGDFEDEDLTDRLALFLGELEVGGMIRYL